MAQIEYIYFGGNTKSFRVVRWLDGKRKVEVAMAFGKTRTLDVKMDEVTSVSPDSFDVFESVGFNAGARRRKLRVNKIC